MLTDSERTELIGVVAAKPTSGDLMQGAGGARKLRWGAKGKGRSGGAPVITFYGGPKIPVFLRAIFAKDEKANLSKAEQNEWRQGLAELVADYRTGAI